MFLLSLCQKETIKTSQQRIQRSVYQNEYKTKSENKNTKNEYIFSNQTLLELIDYLFQFIQIKIPILKDLKLEDITYQNHFLIIMTSQLMEKTVLIKQLVLI